MNESAQPISPDDPRVTAYALGELPELERLVIEAALIAQPALQTVVNDIRVLSGELEAVLAAEPLPTAAIAPKTDDSALRFSPEVQPAGESRSEFDFPKRAKIFRFPGLYYVLATAAAAGFAILVATRDRVDLGRASSPMMITFIERKAEPAGAPSFDAQPDQGATQSAVGLSGRIGSQTQSVLSPFNVAAPSASPASRPVARMTPGSTVTAPSPLAVERSGGTESYAFRAENAFLSANENPLSTFSIDVDTASYSNVRRMLADGNLPPSDAVRIEELVNYFPYSYTGPESDPRDAGASAPFAAHLEVGAAPWAPEHRLVRIGLKGREVSAGQRGAASLVFLLDVSGSMSAANKLPLVKDSLRLLLDQLRDDDRVAIVTYAGHSGLALPSTPVARRSEIARAIESLEPAGSTAGARGIELAYDVAKANHVAGGLNRVILCTDGDFNVGPSSDGELVRLIEEKARSGVYLTVLGFGMGNLKDSTLEKLADKGHGAYGYVDTRSEARKLLVEQVSGTLVTIAKDVKLQVEFNPARVASYRLIGYENRLLAKEDFNNDAIDAGEIGAGHTVTALYEVVPVGRQVVGNDGRATDDLKYSKSPEVSAAGETSNELLTFKVRFKDPMGDVSRKQEFSLLDAGATFEDASADFQFAAAVAGFGMVLRDSPHRGKASFAVVGEWARKSSGRDPGGYRAEFLGLVRQADRLVR